MIIVRLSSEDAGPVGAQFGLAAVETGAKVGGVVRMYGELLAMRVKAHASGRPGPNAPTGDYRRSIESWFFPVVGGGFAMVGTNKPQGRRLEFGFVGRDRLGRVFNQPPYPHFGPAMDDIEPAFGAAMEEVSS